METSKVNPREMLRAGAMAGSSMATQVQASRISPAITPNASQFDAQNPNVIPGSVTQDPINYAAQGVTDLYAPVLDDWFWNAWMNNAKANGMTADGVLPKLGKVWVPEQYWAYAQRKQEQAFQEDFNRFVFSQVNVNTPEARNYWEKKFPGYTQKVYDAWTAKMQVQAKLAEIQIKGFQSEADLWFAFQYQNGYFDRMLAPPTSRLVPVEDDQPQNGITNRVSFARVPPNAGVTQMPPIP